MRNRSVIASAATAVLFLFFLQLLSDFVGGIYALNLLAFSMSSGDLAALYLVAPEQAAEQVMIEILRNSAAGLMLLSPILLILVRSRRAPAAALVVLAELIVACRIAAPVLPPRARMLVSGLGAAGFLALFPLWIRREATGDPERGGVGMGTGIAFALLASIFLRAAGRGVDLSLDGRFQVVGWALGVLAAVLVPSAVGTASAPERFEPSPSRRAGRTTVISLGVMGLVFLIYAVLSSPTALTRWIEGDYVLVTAAAAVAAAAFIVAALARPQLLLRLPMWLLGLWNAAFVLALFLSVVLHRTPFPADPSAYPAAASRSPAAAQLTVPAMLLLSPIVLLDLTLLIGELAARPPSIRALGGGFAVGALTFLLLVFAVIFTTIWDYVPVVGPLFRDRLHLVLLVASAVAVLPALLAGAGSRVRATSPCRGAALKAGSAAAVLLCAAAAAAAAAGEGSRRDAGLSPDTISVLTWNIQAGVNVSGRPDFAGQLEVLREERPDVIGLQESDTARITGGNTDVVRYFASHLGYHSYYGPKTVTGTFGIALLSRFPIEEPRTFYLWSEGEQTAAIDARIRVGNTALRVIVTHLGNYGPIEQQRNVLALARGKSPLVLMGDLNFDSSTEQYAMTAAELLDCRAAVGKVVGDEIDHIFVTPGTEILAFRHAGEGRSDHPAALAVLRLRGNGGR